jgi:hypothetical protein
MRSTRTRRKKYYPSLSSGRIAGRRFEGTAQQVAPGAGLAAPSEQDQVTAQLTRGAQNDLACVPPARTSTVSDRSLQCSGTCSQSGRVPSGVTQSSVAVPFPAWGSISRPGSARERAVMARPRQPGCVARSDPRLWAPGRFWAKTRFSAIVRCLPTLAFHLPPHRGWCGPPMLLTDVRLRGWKRIYDFRSHHGSGGALPNGFQGGSMSHSLSEAKQ